MIERSWTRFLDSLSENLKSKIKIRKLVEIVSIVLVLMLVGPVAEAQQTGKVFRIGFLDNSTASGSAVLVDVFRQELSKLGWIEGKNIAIESRFADGRNDRLPELA